MFQLNFSAFDLSLGVCLFKLHLHDTEAVQTSGRSRILQLPLEQVRAASPCDVQQNPNVPEKEMLKMLFV